MAALMTGRDRKALAESQEVAVSEIDGVPLFDDRPIDFSGVGQNIDGVPMVRVIRINLISNFEL